MQDQPSRRHLPLGVIAGFSALVLATGSAVAWWGLNPSRRAPAPTAIENSQSSSQSSQEAQNPAPIGSTPTSLQKAEPKIAAAPTERTLQIYWLKPSDSTIDLAPTPVKLSTTGNSDALLKAALNQLLAGPDKAAVTTTIPRGTQLRNLSVQDGGIRIDLSQEFTQGGGTASMTGRVAQILYTATSLNPDAPIWLSVEGKPLETLGGEGLVLDQPLTRQSFKENFSL